MEHKLQYLKSVRSTKALPLDIEKFTELILSPEVATNVQLARLALADHDIEQYAVLKQKLPAIMWCGVSDSLSRKAETLKPTGLFMVDIDHLKSASPVDVFMDTMRHNEKLDCPWEIVASHTTPSGNGIRFVAVCRPNLTTLRANMDAFVSDFHLDEVGDYDSACKDLSRLSFIVPECDWYMYGAAMFEDHETDFLDYGHNEKCCFENEEESNNEGESLQNADSSQLLNEQEEEIKNTATYKNNLVADIAEKYVEVFGTPEQGERHNYYNTMVKNFRLICNNDPKVLHAVLPRFGNSYDETKKQCQGICRSNMVTRLPREFYLFLRQNGFYPLQSDTILTQPKEDEQEEEQQEEIPLPVLPPIFREFCSVCPKDFTLPTIDALLPILGTLTSYLRADYYDGMEQSTSFYTVLYAPPSSSKSFVKRLMDPLFHLIYARDEVATLRENIYIDEVNAKGANDKSPDDPHVAVRIMPVINSQAEFLTKMKDNKGYHMFTF
ncbi:MAG: hypothetical protein KBT27_08675, partial [Prevotellaceae bacterium]|nr:hypothetical protein [Candidatus Faecinaster equi]